MKFRSSLMEPEKSSPPPTYPNSSPPPKEEEVTRNWLDLPPDVTSAIFQKVGAIEILKNAQYVCAPWRSICRSDPSIWRSIDLFDCTDDQAFWSDPDCELAREAVSRSRGQLLDIRIAFSGTDDFIHYLAQSSSQLCRLRILCCQKLSEDVLKETAAKFPLLEELEVQSTPLSIAAVEAIGLCCRQLKSFKCNVLGFTPRQAQDDALANIVAQTMPQLCHLQLVMTMITNTGLKAILKGCICLETLDLRGCYRVNEEEDNLGKLCSKRLKHVRFPKEPFEQDEFERLAINYSNADARYCGSDFGEPFYSDGEDLEFDDDDDEGMCSDYNDFFGEADDDVVFP